MGKYSKYKGIYHYKHNQRSKALEGGFWVATIMHKGKRYKKTFNNERDAALAYDKMCLSFGLEPVNILVRK